MAKKNAIVSTELLTGVPGGPVLVIRVEGFDDLRIARDDITNDIAETAIFHGLKQKVVDAAALPKNEDGNVATPGDKYHAMAAVVAQITGPGGEWNKRGEGSGDSAPSGLIFRAYAEVMTNLAAKKKVEVSPEKLREMYDAKSRSDQLALRTNPDIAKVMERIKSERGAGKSAKVNSDDLLAELG